MSAEKVTKTSPCFLQLKILYLCRYLCYNLSPNFEGSAQESTVCKHKVGTRHSECRCLYGIIHVKMIDI